MSCRTVASNMILPTRTNNRNTEEESNLICAAAVKCFILTLLFVSLDETNLKSQASLSL